jgi:hypothetical protein
MDELKDILHADHIETEAQIERLNECVLASRGDRARQTRAWDFSRELLMSYEDQTDGLQSQKRTAFELEQIILTQATFEGACPRHLRMTVVPLDDKWDVVPEIIE